jgi:hypothetical protein
VLHGALLIAENLPEKIDCIESGLLDILGISREIESFTTRNLIPPLIIVIFSGEMEIFHLFSMPERCPCVADEGCSFLN